MLTHCAICRCTTPVIAISDNVTTPSIFKSKTEELHHLHMELQLLKDQIAHYRSIIHICNITIQQLQLQYCNTLAATFILLLTGHVITCDFYK